MNKNLKIKFDVPVSALERWNKKIHAAEKTGEHVVNIYSTVGEYGDGEGITAGSVSRILDKAGDEDIVVNINSGGGDFFEGLAIHTLLKEHAGNVKVNVVGLAASAASIIAMAGDEISISEEGFMMIHNSWMMAIGNSEDLKEISEMLAKFDDSMAKLYAKVTGIDEKEIREMMAAETWLSGSDAVDRGFATSFIGEDEIEIVDEIPQPKAYKKVDLELARAGVPRSERRALLKQITTDTPRAVEVTPSADNALNKALLSLLSTIKS